MTYRNKTPVSGEGSLISAYPTDPLKQMWRIINTTSALSVALHLPANHIEIQLHGKMLACAVEGLENMKG